MTHVLNRQQAREAWANLSIRDEYLRRGIVRRPKMGFVFKQVRLGFGDYRLCEIPVGMLEMLDAEPT